MNQTTVARPVRVIQLTDTHLHAGLRETLLGVDTQATLEAVVAQVLKVEGVPDLVLLTGDLVHDGSEIGYHRLAEVVGRLRAPVYCLPGNHDDLAMMSRFYAGEAMHLAPVVDAGAWRIVMLDSTVPGLAGGRLSVAELQRLDDCLAAYPKRPALVCLHHHPVSILSSWMDTMILENGDDLFAVLDRHPQVRAVLWGHIHQAYDARYGAVRLLSSPSTCVQFVPRATACTVDPAPPGYRWLTLAPDGTLETGVGRADPETLVKSRAP